TLRLPGDRLAAFICSFGAADVATCSLVGTKGVVSLENAYEYSQAIGMEAAVGGKKQNRQFAMRDQFAPELLYFSDCILRNREPEPSGEEGLQDVRIVEALYESARSGKPVTIRPFTKTVRPTGRQRLTRPGIKKPTLIKVQSASQ